VLLGHVGAGCAAEAQPSLAPREAEVLSAVINHGLEAGVPMVVIAEQTTGDPAAIAADGEVVAAVVASLEIPPSLFADWARRNAAISRIDRPLNLAVTYKLLEAEAHAELFAGTDPAAGWRQFFERYAGTPGLLRVSHVGFDETGVHALVYFEHQCGADCGAGRLVHLARDSGAWQVKGGALVWLSD
jgi:hypothetical protein